MTLFLDRDGIINRKRPEGDYVKSWEEFEFLPGALLGLRRMAASGARMICVTNQRGVARGRMTEDALMDIHRRMLGVVQEAGGRIDAVYYCPHEAGQCDCRKPLTGLFQRARMDFPDIVFADSLVVGDTISDMAAASRLGCGSALVAMPEIAAAICETAAGQGIRVDFRVQSLLELAELLPAWRFRTSKQERT
ncbi:MAG: HAD family hydrolase [Acidobacteriia bacterium]|nr:HAD family hydrolase [Terriglobia bacterium]